MRRFSSILVATLMNAICVASAFAADARVCVDCDVATALAKSLQPGDRRSSGLRAAGGYWIVIARFEDLNSAELAGPARLHDNSSGTYTFATRPGILSSAIEDPPDLFLQQRAGDDPGNPLGEHVGAGVVYRSAAVQGWRGEFGVAVGFAELAAPFQRALGRSGIAVAERETSCELSYRVAVTERFAVQSDVQFIRNPGMNESVDSSWTVGLRFEFSSR
jgi:porin